jgi:hypothetical protein
MINKKKAELSINMIVVVALAIIVLVIVIYLVVNQSKSAQKAVSCASYGGVCTQYCRNPNGLTDDPTVCTNSPNLICCNPLDVISRT